MAWVRNRLAQDGVDPGGADLDGRIVEGLRVPEWHPAVTAIVVAEDGQVWFRGPETFEETVLWTRFGRDGVATATLVAKREFEGHFAADGSVLGVEVDELDLPWIVSYSSN